MSSLKVRTYRDGSGEPVRTVTVPGPLLRFAVKYVPGKTGAFLRDHDIDLGKILADLRAENYTGTLAEIEDHARHERIVVALE